ncbi:hypothetical protein BP6252_02004 [Coleophoma cylindrospora]|uniref:Uncharacterized protein n=1 Tax=Coleophoma cylindrospora TaxID=1849047 RepID=A0A3D8SE91_9HELO|nr:hypothetical protein BP6252_02004 [Coleophoma cylindrospora]
MGVIIKAGLLATVLLVFYKVKTWLLARDFRKWEEAHGCGPLPSVKNKLPGGLERFALLVTGLGDKDFLDDFVRKRFNDNGNTHRIHSLFRTVVSTAEPENIQAILATQFHDFNLGPARHGNLFALLGNGIFNSDGEPWAHYRAQLKPQFTRDQVSDLEAADRHLNILYKALPEESSAGWTSEVDLKPLFFNLTLDASTEFLFGHSVNSQARALSSDNTTSEDVKLDKDFAEAMTYAQEYIAYRLRFANLYWMANSKKFQQACQTVKDFGDKYVRIALDPNNKHSTVNSDGKERFVLLNAVVEETKDPIEVRDQMLHLLLAGRDTTSSLLCWVFLLLSRNPSEFQILRNAVLEEFGSASKPTAEMTFSSLKACKPLTNLLYEALRIYPIVPLNGRRAVRNTTLPTGGGPDGKQPIAVKKGENVGFISYVMHRRHDIWGEDADEFRPARWEKRKIGWNYVPFSGGPRVCLGREYLFVLFLLGEFMSRVEFTNEICSRTEQYALTEAAFVVARFAQRFDAIDGVDITSPIKKKMSLTMAPASVKVRLHRATEPEEV